MARKSLLHIKSVEVCGPHSLWVSFTDGVEKRVDLSPLLEGPVFQPLLDSRYFSRVTVDPTTRTVVWPNGADLAPEALWDLPEEPVATKKVAARKRRGPPRKRVKPARADSSRSKASGARRATSANGKKPNRGSARG